MVYASHWKRYLSGIILKKLSPTLGEAQKNKNKLYIKSIKHKCVHNETVYKNYRNCLKKFLKAAEKKYYNDLISKYKSDSKTVWSIIKLL